MKKILFLISLIITTTGYYLTTNSDILFENESNSCEVIAELSVFEERSSTLPVNYEYNHVQIQKSRIKSTEFLASTIKLYQLDTLYNTDSVSLITEIKNGIDAHQFESSKSILIKISYPSKIQSDQIAYAIVHHYEEYYKAKNIARVEDALNKFKSKTLEQEQLVLKLKKSLARQGWQKDTADDKPFLKIVERYKKELHTLKTIKSLDLSNIDKSGLRSSLVIHQTSWSDETAAFIEARRHTK